MILTDEHINEYKNTGLLIIENVLTEDYIINYYHIVLIITKCCQVNKY